MAERTVFSFRVPDEDADRFEAMREQLDRDRSDLARRVFRAGLDAMARDPGISAMRYGTPVTAVPNAVAMTPAEHEQHTRSSGPHPYVPREGNALRCGTCGLAKGQHPR